MVDASPFSNANTLLSSLQFPPQKIASVSGLSSSTAAIFGKNDQLPTHQQPQWNYLKIDLPASMSSNFASATGGIDVFAHANGISPIQSLRNDLFNGLASPVVSSTSSDWANNIIASILSSPSSASVFPNLSFSQPISSISNGVSLASMARNTPTPPFRELSSPLGHPNGLSSPALSINGADADLLFNDEFHQVPPAGTKKRRIQRNSNPNSNRKRRKSNSASVKSPPTNLNPTTSDFSPLGTGAAAGTGSEAEDDIFIDTKELCNRIAYELKAHSIPQSIFAERVLGRSQGTLSDLLRNPKPWNKLKSGRDTFRRMYEWLRQSLPHRLKQLDLWEGDDLTGKPVILAPKPKRKLSGSARSRSTASPDEDLLDNYTGAPEAPFVNEEVGVARFDASAGPGSNAAVEDAGASPPPKQTRRDSADAAANHAKRQRLVFTDIQKRTLQAIFKETQRPSKEMQQTISEHLGLDVSTVQNFFMNARRRCRDRFDPAWDQPKPNQEVINVSPPPAAVAGVNDPGGRMPATNFLDAPKSESRAAAAALSPHKRSVAKSSTNGNRSNPATTVAIKNSRISVEHSGTTRTSRRPVSKSRQKSTTPVAAAAVAVQAVSSSNNASGSRPMRQNWDTIDQVVNAVAAGLFPPLYENLADPAPFADSGPILTSADFETTPIGLQSFSTAAMDGSYTSIFDMKDLPLKLEMKEKNDIADGSLLCSSAAAAVEKPAAGRSQSLPFIGTLISREFGGIVGTSGLGPSTPPPSMLIGGGEAGLNSTTQLTALTTMQPMDGSTVGVGVAPGTVYQSTLLYPPPIGMAVCTDSAADAANSLPADFLEMPLTENLANLGVGNLNNSTK